MKVYGIKLKNVNGIELYMRANSRAQSRNILSYLENTLLSPDVQYRQLKDKAILPSVFGNGSELLAPDPLATTRQVIGMTLNGLSLSGTLSLGQDDKYMSFRRQLGFLKMSDNSGGGWVTYPFNKDGVDRFVQIDATKDGVSLDCELFIRAQSRNEAQTMLDTLRNAAFRNKVEVKLNRNVRLLSPLPDIRISRMRADTKADIYELMFKLSGIELQATVNETNFRSVLLMCANFGVRLRFDFTDLPPFFVTRELIRMSTVQIFTRAGAPEDVRPVLSPSETHFLQECMDDAVKQGGLTPARHGRQFNGVIVNATPGDATSGFVYLASPDFKPGQFILTGEVVHVGTTGKNTYIETLDGYRFLITSYDPGYLQELKTLMQNNPSYYGCYRWSA